MKISIITPTHNAQYLPALYESIWAQDFAEWIIIPNNGAQIPDFSDPRIKVFTLGVKVNYVGALKKFACAQATGDIILEVDHDDLLMPGAISEVRQAFADPAVGFVYSDCACFQNDFENVPRYDAIYGWQYEEIDYHGHKLDCHKSFEPTPAAVSRIWYAPNHLRAWRRMTYELAGGHSEDMRVLDDQDLMARLYQIAKFHHIEKCLYLYRVTGENTWLKHNDEIQSNVMRIYDQYIYQLCYAWSMGQSLYALDLGGRINKAEGWSSVDTREADICCDLNGRWPFEDNSVGVIRAHDLIEHLYNPIHTMKEIYRVLIPGGYFLSKTPSTDGRGAFQDPTHKSFWNENAFWYYTRSDQARFIDTPVRFQPMRLYTDFPDAWHKQNNIPYVFAHLVSLKDGFRPPGIVEV